MPRAGAAGLSMYYELAGEGPAVVFISGITADHAGWKPGSELTVIAGAGHAVHVEKSIEFNRAVLGFLGSAS